MSEPTPNSPTDPNADLEPTERLAPETRRALIRRRFFARESVGARVWRLFKFAFRRASDERITQVASSLTFTSVLSIVPLLAVALALFTAFPLFNEFQGALEAYLVSNLMPPSVADNIMTYLNQFAASASRLTAVGGIFLMVTAVSLMLTIDHALNEIWHVRKGRALPQRVLIYWATLTLGPVLMGGSLWATSIVARESMGLVGGLAPVEWALSFLPLVLTGLAFAALFVVVPNRHVEARDALVGGFAAAIVLELLKAGFAYYLTRFPTYTVLYGAFATLPIFLIWVYMSWLVTLFGATLAASLPLIRMGRLEDERHPGAPVINALAILRMLMTARSRNSAGVSTKALRNRVNLRSDELMEVLETLATAGYIARVGDAGSSRERWALICDPEQVLVAPIIDKLLVDRPVFEKEAPSLLQALDLAWVDRDATLCEVLLEERHAEDAGPGAASKTAEQGARKSTEQGTRKNLVEFE